MPKTYHLQLLYVVVKEKLLLVQLGPLARLGFAAAQGLDLGLHQLSELLQLLHSIVYPRQRLVLRVILIALQFRLEGAGAERFRLALALLLLEALHM